MICQKTPKLNNTNNYRHLGTLGGVSLIENFIVKSCQS